MIHDIAHMDQIEVESSPHSKTIPKVNILHICHVRLGVKSTLMSRRLWSHAHSCNDTIPALIFVNI